MSVKTGFELVEELYRQAFGHDVRELMRRWDMKHAHLSKSNLLTDEVNVDLDVLWCGGDERNWLPCRQHSRCHSRRPSQKQLTHGVPQEDAAISNTQQQRGPRPGTQPPR
jgi:hypothetical protein